MPSKSPKPHPKPKGNKNEAYNVAPASPAKIRARQAGIILTTPDNSWHDTFLDALAVVPNIAAAAAAAGINRTTAYVARDHNPEFKRRWDEALGEGCDNLELEAYRRAVDGVERVRLHTYEGEIVARVTEREYSDTLLLALLRRHRPEAWVEKHQVLMAARSTMEMAVGNGISSFDWTTFDRLFGQAISGEPDPHRPPALGSGDDESGASEADGL